MKKCYILSSSEFHSKMVSSISNRAYHINNIWYQWAQRLGLTLLELCHSLFEDLNLDTWNLVWFCTLYTIICNIETTFHKRRNSVQFHQIFHAYTHSRRDLLNVNQYCLWVDLGCSSGSKNCGQRAPDVVPIPDHFLVKDRPLKLGI